MLHVSLSIEALRARPALVAWTAALAQAVLWVVVPVFFYAAPPGDLPEFLAVGHEFQMGTYLGPPLTYWLAELAFNLAGGRIIGVYVLSQVCVLVTYWAVFKLGRSMVGERQAVGTGAAARVVRDRAGTASILVRAGDRNRAAAAHHLFRVDLLRAPGGIHLDDGARTGGAQFG
jgi:hypothetical protein